MVATLAVFRHGTPAPTLAGRPPEGRELETTSPPPATVPTWTQWGSIRGIRAVMQTFLIFPLMGAFSPLTVIDRYRVKSIKGGAVFVSNHSSALDAVVMLQALPNRFRFRAFVVAAADSIFKRKWEAHSGVQMVRIGYERYGMQVDLEVIEDMMVRENNHFKIEELNTPRQGRHSKDDRIERLEPGPPGAEQRLRRRRVRGVRYRYRHSAGETAHHLRSVPAG